MKMVCQPRTKNQRRNQVQMKLDVSSLAHTKWECKYHIVFAPKYRRQIIYGKIKQDIGQMLRKLCEYKGIADPRSRSVQGSYPYARIHTTEIQRIADYGISQGKEQLNDL